MDRDQHPAGGGVDPVAWIGIDSGTCAFGDAARIDPDFRLKPGLIEPSPLRVEDCTGLGIPLIGCGTTQDMTLDVEVLRDDDGVPVAARMCFTNDVDELPGRWHPAGKLDITGGAVLAADPYCSPTRPYREQIQLSNGTYLAEVFGPSAPGLEGDILALRIRRSDVGLPRVQGPLP